MKNNTIRFKISILYVSILGIILLFFSIYPIYTVYKILQSRIKESLLDKVKRIDDYVDVYTIKSQNDQSTATLLDKLFRGEKIGENKKMDELWARNTTALGLENDLYRIRNHKGEEILRSNNFTPDAERIFNDRFTGSENTVHFSYFKVNGLPYYGVNYDIFYNDYNTLNLQLAHPISFALNILHGMVLSCLGGILIILIGGIFVARYLTRKILKPVEDVSRLASDITHKNLSLRIPDREYDSEIRELVGSFNEMIGRLGDSFGFINEFNANLSHEMKTPLAIIKGELELALEAGNTKEENERVMKNILEEVYRLIRTTKELLLLSEYEHKFDLFKMERMDLNLFLKEVVEHSKLLADEKNIGLELLAQDKPLWITGDPIHLRRVFFNLIHNGVKFTPAGGEINILTEVFDRSVFISIKDTGIGIAQENQARIFEKFYRVRTGNQDVFEGNGLGLCMAQAIVRAHKGDITVESEVNKGSIFKVSLPISLQ